MASGLRFEPASYFLTQNIPEPAWVWENQLAEGCVSFVVGQPKTGKSCFVRSLIKSIATGTDFLGHRTIACPIAYLALEDHPSFLQQSLKKADINFDHIHLHYGSIKCGTVEENLKELETLCKENQIKFAVIDPMIKFAKISNTNDYTETVEAVGQIVDFARKNNVHVMMVHHSNKSKDDGPTQMLGSTGLFGSCDGAFFISRKDNVGCIKSNLRYGKSLESVNFSFDEKGLVQFQGAKSENDLNVLENDVVEFLQDKTGVTFLALREQFKVRTITLKDALDDLLEDGRIERSGTGKSNSPYFFFIPNNDFIGVETEKVSIPIPLL
ncbi:MAG: AAA family ATPase [Pseudobdellovibrio sp.]